MVDMKRTNGTGIDLNKKQCIVRHIPTIKINMMKLIMEMKTDVLEILQ